MVCLDVDTRWNSTYTMLDVTVKYKGAFIRMITEDSSYEAYFKVDNLGVSSDNGKKKKKTLVEGAPFFVDFDNVIRFIQFLEIFYDVTLKLSGSKYCTSNVFFVELVKVQEAIVKLCSSDDMLMGDMTNRMMDKYNKYWDNMENTNILLYVAVVLDPRYKMSYIDFYFAKIYGRGSTKCFMMCDKVLKTLQELFDHYKNLKGHADFSPSSKTNRPNNT
ncbi:zinc finger BED domain-containing protein RICESLEEPER 1-like [Apium graveolens]|uniref:zinc finger BED domain-containing protein RICESLEEPER 1-like n=1 Tax=Apium graveolens TaxID=4045 RepID=UPI003D7B6976